MARLYKRNGWISRLSEFRELYKEDRHYAPYGVLLAIKDRFTQEIVATVRMTLKKEHLSFPFEYFFGVDVEKLCQSLQTQPDEIWHCGRISIDKDKLRELGYGKREAITILKVVIKYIYKIGSGSPSNLLLGENFVKTQRFYDMVGFNMKIMAKKEYFPGVLGCASYMQAASISNHEWLKN